MRISVMSPREPVGWMIPSEPWRNSSRVVIVELVLTVR